MTDELRPPPAGRPEEPANDEMDEVTPQGTLFTLMVYIMVLGGMWGVLYWTLLSR